MIPQDFDLPEAKGEIADTKDAEQNKDAHSQLYR
jgi:hypothetical protein